MKLSVLIPVYNEQASVEAIVRRVAAMDLSPVTSRGVSVELEIIAVDDCSTDATTGILARLHGGPAEAPGEGPRRSASQAAAVRPVPHRAAAGAREGAAPVAAPPAERDVSSAECDPAGGPDRIGSVGEGAAQGCGSEAPASEIVPGLRVIQHGYNQGKGAAIRTALAAATGDYVLIQDADFEYDPADIPRLLLPVAEGKAQVVYGARPLDGSGGRRLLDLGNRALTWLTNLLYGTRLHDMETCYKLLPTALLRSFDLECNRFDMEPEITAKVVRSGYRIYEVPISYHPRPPHAGGKKLSARKDGLPALKALLRYRFWKPPRRESAASGQ